MKIRFQNITQSGETLLELTMAAGLAVLVISALTITTIIGLRNSQLSQNQTQATKLAQEGIEKVRSLRSRNQSVCLDLGSPMPWDSVFTASDFTNKEFKLNGANCSDPSGNYLVTSAAPDLSPTTSLPFTRRLYLTKTGSKQINVTSTVSWRDYSGPHQTELITVLSNQ